MSIQGPGPLRSATVALALAAALVAGCGAPHPGVSNGSVSACYRAIPAAESALHDSHAALIGVHRIAVDKVRDRLPVSARAEMAAENDTEVCAIAFKGNFIKGQVDLAPPTEQGTYAIVLVSSRHLNLVASVILADLPRSLGKRTL